MQRRESGSSLAYFLSRCAVSAWKWWGFTGCIIQNRTKNELYISFSKYFDRKVEYKPYVVNKITLGNGWSIERLSTTFELSTYICPNVLSIFKALSYAIQSCNINDFSITYISILFISNRHIIQLNFCYVIIWELSST